jgi:hypothetical protein
MSTQQRTSSPIFDAADQEVVQYRALSSLALAGLCAGLLSPLALVDAALWVVPLAAVLVSGVALWRIDSRWPELVGRPAALAGLLLGTAFLVAAPVDDFVFRYFLRRQAREFSQIWIEAVRHGELYKAHHLLVDPRRRLPLENKLADFYRQNETYRRMLTTFANEPAVRTLFALGTSAEIRYYETTEERCQEYNAVEQQIYSVTYLDEHKQPTTFFISLVMERTIDTSNGRAGWTLMRVDGGVRPPGW